MRAKSLIQTFLNINTYNNSPTVEDQLKISDEILNHINALILVADTNGDIIYTSPACKIILGYEQSEILGNGWWELSCEDPEERVRKKKFFASCVRREIILDSAPYENEVLDKNGNPRWIRWSDSVSEAGFAVGIGQDVTERVLAEKKMKVYSSRLLLLNKVTRLMLSSDSFQDTLVSVLTDLKSEFESCQRVGLAIIDESGISASFTSVVAESKDIYYKDLNLKDLTSLDSLKRREPFFVENMQSIASPSETDRIAIEAGIKSYAVFPISFGKDLLGFIHLDFRIGRALTSEDVEILQSITNEISIAIQQDRLKQNLIENNLLLEKRNEDITASLRYAKRLQEAILPPEAYVEHLLEKYFIIYKPKDIISGDFYWIEELEGKVLIAAADCTGHGAPGAFMSVVGNNLLNQATNIHKLTQPSLILDLINNELSKVLHNKTDGFSIKDGMDIVLCSVDKARKVLHFSGANNALWLVRGEELQVIKGDKFPVGAFEENFNSTFTNHEIPICAGDTIYIFSDGFVDQFGGPKGKKFKNNNLRELLLSIRTHDIASQKILIEEAFYKWKGSLEQVDDILFIGIRF